MATKLVFGPFDKGLQTNRTAFVIDQNSFPVLINAQQWRGRVKRKRGTSLLNRLQRFFTSANTAYGSIATVALDGNGQVNLLTGFSLSPTATIVPKTLVVTVGVNTYTDSLGDGTLSPSGSINYASGLLTILAEAGNNASARFNYYPNLPVLGFTDGTLDTTQNVAYLTFDTQKAYNVNPNSPYNITNVSWYKNPQSGGGYTAKTNPRPTSWNGEDYRQYNAVNYQNAIFVTNNINRVFNPTKFGMQFIPAASITSATQLTATTVQFNIPGGGLEVGDFVFANEFTGASASTLNFQTGFVTAVAAPNYTVTFPSAAIGAAGLTPGILQTLSRQTDATKDCIRFYDGNPTDGTVLNPAFVQGKGWVNFMPPLSQAAFSIADLPAAQYYLVGARIITVYKDRLLFLGPVIQSSTSAPIYLQDTIIYSQNGTPYYTASFSGSVTSGLTQFNALYVPVDQTATANSFFGDVAGYGGFIEAGFAQPINTASVNEDVLILGIGDRQVRVVYTSNDLIPFNFYIINSEYGSESTNTAINFDRGVISVGQRGFIQANQSNAGRIDPNIPDEIFQFNLKENGFERSTAARDFVNEWIYFSYPHNSVKEKYNNRTLVYNYRDQSWSVYYESFTAYGSFRRRTGNTWQTIGQKFPTWSQWNEPWNAGTSTILQPEILAGTAQGFVLVRDEGTAEGNNIGITNINAAVATITNATQAAQCVITCNNTFVAGQQVLISGVVGMTQLNGIRTVVSATPTTATLSVNSTAFGAYVSGGLATPTKKIVAINHMLNNGDFIVVSGVVGMTSINNKVFQVFNVDATGFDVDLNGVTGTYQGAGVAKRCYRPKIQSKQVPFAWSQGRKTRIGVQQYLLSTTDQGQVTINIYLSQNNDTPWNIGPIVPAPNSQNNALIYSSLLYTCPESTNLGLTPYQINLNNPLAQVQAQTWHRLSTSLIGDTFQFEITLNDEQMKDPQQRYVFKEIEFHGAIIDCYPSMVLA